MFFNFKGKIVFGDPPLPQIPTPLERESLPPKTPQMRGTPGLGSRFLDFFTKTEPSPQDCKFFKVFQSFSMFFKVFQCFSGFLSLSSDEGPPPRPFHSLILVKGGLAFFNFKGKIVFGDPPLPQTPTPP